MNSRLVGVLAIMVVATAACTTGASTPSPTLSITTTTAAPGSTTTTVLAADVMEVFRTCLAEGGVFIEEIPFDAVGRPRLDLVMVGLDFSDPAVAEALTICSKHLSTGALSLSEAPEIEILVAELLAEFSECVRSQGVPAFPDPVSGFLGIGGPYPVAAIPYADLDLESAVAICRDRLR